MKWTLKALSLAGGGVLATWLAATPAPPTSGALERETSAHAAAVQAVTLGDLDIQEANLRKHEGNVALTPSTRNPFRFVNATPVKTLQTPATAIAVAPPPASAPQPLLYLSGIATEGATRTAIISGDGQLYLVKEGEPIAGRYHVLSIDRDGVMLRDDDGTERRLVLH